jgi:hypothetical protein
MIARPFQVLGGILWTLYPLVPLGGRWFWHSSDTPGPHAASKTYVAGGDARRVRTPHNAASIERGSEP